MEFTHKTIPDTDFDLVCTKSDNEVVKVHIFWMRIVSGTIRNILETFPECRRFEIASTKEDVDEAMVFTYAMIKDGFRPGEWHPDMHYRLFEVFRILDIEALMDASLYTESLQIPEHWPTFQMHSNPDEVDSFMKSYAELISKMKDVFAAPIDYLLKKGSMDLFCEYVMGLFCRISQSHMNRIDFVIEDMGRDLLCFGTDFIVSVIKAVMESRYEVAACGLGSDIVVELLCVLIDAGVKWQDLKKDVYDHLPLSTICFFYTDGGDNGLIPQIRKVREFVGYIDHEEALRHDLIHNHLWYNDLAYGGLIIMDGIAHATVFNLNPMLVSSSLISNKKRELGSNIYDIVHLKLSDEELSIVSATKYKGCKPAF